MNVQLSMETTVLSHVDTAAAVVGAFCAAAAEAAVRCGA
jgi:hypothetical protein